MLRTLFAILFACACAAAGCQRPTAEQCERLCWRYNELAYWERFQAEAGSLAPEAREKLRAERQKIWDQMRARTFDPGLENCLKDCRRSASPDDVACVEQARTVKQAARCLE